MNTNSILILNTEAKIPNASESLLQSSGVVGGTSFSFSETEMGRAPLIVALDVETSGCRHHDGAAKDLGYQT